MRKLSLAIVPAGAVVLALVVGVVFLVQNSTAQDLDLVGVSRGELAERGIVLETPRGDDHALVDAERAGQVALDRYGPDASVREVKLTRWGGEDITSLKNGQLVWIVNVDPDSVPPPQIGGGTLKPLPTGPDGIPDWGKLRYLLIFVDAESGEFLHSSGSVERPN